MAWGLTSSGLMTPECIMGLVINLGVGIGDELASEVEDWLKKKNKTSNFMSNQKILFRPKFVSKQSQGLGTQILCEINFGECRSSKITSFAISGALNKINFENFSLQKM